MRHFRRVVAGVLEPAPAEPGRRARNLGPAVLGAELERVAASDPREVVRDLQVVHLVHVGPERAGADGLEPGHQRQRIAVVQAIVDGVSGSAQHAEGRVQRFFERNVEPRREERVAEAEFVELGRSEGRVQRRRPILARQIDRLAVAAVGGQRQAPVLQHELVPNRIAREPAVAVVDVVIEPHVVLVVIDRVGRREEVVVPLILPSRDVRGRVVGEQSGRDGIEPVRRDPEVRERLARGVGAAALQRQRIVDPAIRIRLVGKVAGQGGPARHRGGETLACPVLGPLEAEEAEELVPDDGPADSRAVLVPPQCRLRRAHPVRHEIRAVELVVADELVQGAVELVRARLGAHEDLRAHPVAVLGRHVVRDDLELADGVDGRLGGLSLEAQGAARVAGRIVRAVEEDIGLGGVHADREDAAFASPDAVMARSLAHLAGRQDAHGEFRQLEVVAAVERHFENALGVDDLPDLGLLRLDQDRRGADLHRFGDRADGQFAVEAHGLLHFEPKLGELLAGEPFGRARHRVQALVQARHRVEADFVARNGVRHARFDVGHENVRAGNHGAGVIGDNALDGAARLAEGGREGEDSDAQ